MASRRTKLLEPAAPNDQKATPEQWLDRLSTLLRTMDAMDIDERAAALRYVKSKFGREWPSSDEY